MRHLLPMLIVLLGLGAGMSVGWFMKPGPVPSAEEALPEKYADGAESEGTAETIPDPVADHGSGHGEGVQERSYVTVGNQTIVPVVDGGRTRALMLFELAVDVDPAAHDAAVMLEPRLRDVFLRELLKMSSTGAFTSTYTEDWVIDELRRNLVSAAKKYLGSSVRDVLVLDVVRQEM